MNKVEIRKAVYDKLDGHCAYCGCEIKIREMQVDHVIPQSYFLHYVKNKFQIPAFLNHLTEIDVNHFDNLMPTCRYCNKHKSAHHLELYRSEIFEQVKRLNLRSSNYRIAKRYGLIQETVKPIVFYFETV